MVCEELGLSIPAFKVNQGTSCSLFLLVLIMSHSFFFFFPEGNQIHGMDLSREIYPTLFASKSLYVFDGQLKE